MNGFLFDMNTVFEDFVCVGLREALSVYGGHAALQARNVYLDEAELIRMRPDLARGPFGETLRDRTASACA
jgi:5-methylcytosine-specific restriction enzyme subunit McrC